MLRGPNTPDDVVLAPLENRGGGRVVPAGQEPYGEPEASEGGVR